MSPNQYYASPHVETSHDRPGNAIGPRTAGAEQSCLQAQRNDRYDSFRLDMIGWPNIYIYICLLDGNYIMDGFCQVSAWFFYWNYIMPYDNHDKHDNEYLYNITNQTFMAHNPSP